MSGLKKVRLRDLIPGQVLKDDIIVSGNRKLASKDTIVTSSLVEKLERWLENLDAFVYVSECDARETKNASNCTSQELDERTIAGINSLYETSWEDFGEKYQNVEKCMQEVVRQVTPDVELGLEFDGMRSIKDGLLKPHGYRTAKLGIIMAHLYNRTVPKGQEIDHLSIAMASLMHDIGKNLEGDMGEIRGAKLDREVIKMLNINPNLLALPYMPDFQTVYAYVALEGRSSETVRKIVLYSGFQNRKLNGVDKYSPEVNAAEIVWLCHIYDKLLELVVQNNITMPLGNVIESLEQMGMTGHVSRDKLNLFLDNLMIYAPGTKVILSTGEEATVLSTTPHYPTMPTVSTRDRVINLSKATNITIERFVFGRESVSEKTEVIMDSQYKGIINP